MFEFLTTHYEQVVSISLSNNLSGTFQAAGHAAQSLGENSHVHLVDSRNVSVGQGLVVKQAASAAAKTADIETLLASLNTTIDTMQTFALVNDLRSAVRSGRLRPAVRHLANWLRLTTTN